MYSTCVVMSILRPMLRASGQRSAWKPCTSIVGVRRMGWQPPVDRVAVVAVRAGEMLTAAAGARALGGRRPAERGWGAPVTGGPQAGRKIGLPRRCGKGATGPEGSRSLDPAPAARTASPQSRGSPSYLVVRPRPARRMPPTRRGWSLNAIAHWGDRVEGTGGADAECNNAVSLLLGPCAGSSAGRGRARPAGCARR